MSKDLNRVQLIGHIGGDPDVRYLESGTAVATFSVATNRTWKDPTGQPHTDTEWSRVVAWGRLAEIAGDYLRKGRRVYIEGRLRTRHWEDHDGQTHYMTEVVAEDLIMLDSRPAEGAPVEELPSRPAPSQPMTEPSKPKAAPRSAPPAPPPPAAEPREGNASPRSMPSVQREPAARRRTPSGVQPRPRVVPPQRPLQDQGDDEDIPF